MKSRLIPLFLLIFATGGWLAGQSQEVHLVAQSEAPAPEEMPWLIQEKAQYPGGVAALSARLAPWVESATKGMEPWEGEVLLILHLDRFGRATPVAVRHCPDTRLEEQLISGAMEMPRWKPAVQAGRPVPVKVGIPIAVRLNRP